MKKVVRSYNESLNDEGSFKVEVLKYNLRVKLTEEPRSRLNL